jgi:hypothetical protein
MVWGNFNFNDRRRGKSAESDCEYPKRRHDEHRDDEAHRDGAETNRGNIHTFVPFVCFFVRLGLVRVGID